MISFVAAAVTLFAMLPSNAALADSSAVNSNGINVKIGSSVKDTSYQAYLAQYPNAVLTGKTINVDPTSFSSGQGVTAEKSYEGKQNVLLTSETGYAEWTINVPETGMYSINLDYYPVAGNGGAIQRTVQIDGSQPYDEAYCVQFSRIYRDATKVVHIDGANDLRPSQVESPDWINAYVQDINGYYGSKLNFYFTAGTHKIRLNSLAEPMAIGSLTLDSQKTSLESYSDYIAQAKSNGAKEVHNVIQGGVKKTQAEDSYQKSDQTLYPAADNTSCFNEPFDPSKQKINTIGGTKWENPGQWISWQIDVPETGLYEIGCRELQNYVRDVNAVRSLYLDGQIPFEEASKIQFVYSDKWAQNLFGTEKNPYLFYMTKGTHVLKLEVSLGDLADRLVKINDCIKILNQADWDLLTVMGTKPDVNRDYNIPTTMPAVISTFKEQAQKLRDIVKQWVGMTGKQDSNVAQINQMIFQIDQMWQHPDKIASVFTNFRSNLGNFANMIESVSEQPVTLDYLYIAEPGATLPKANPNVFTAAKFGILKFLVSFISDYNNLSGGNDMSKAKKSITVWIGNGITGGRDQALVLNQLIRQDFTPKANINVNLELIPPATILTATLAGKGPDVALQVTGSDPANYAMRNAVVDLSKMSGFSDVAKRFSPAAFVGYKYLDGTYAIPETFSFPMMFYRKDIMNQLGIDINTIKSWQDLIAILPLIQRKNMNVGIQPLANSYYTFLYQMGGAIYRNNNKESNLDTKVSQDAFNYFMGFYTNYSLPYVYNFVTRFRTGEIPIGIDDYTNYNVLQVSAPEINGQWGMKPIPGVIGSDGKINNIAPVGGAGCIMMTASKDKASSWEFMKWWTDQDAQFKFGKELESVMGVGARYNTANLAALQKLPWQVQDKQTLMSQISNVEGVPQVPGGYLTDRDVQFAMNAINNNNNIDPRKELGSYVDEINQEISIKRKEFGLPQ